MKKKILIVSQFFFPINNPRSIRTTELAKEFARQGHNVTVITPKDEIYHPKFEKTNGLVIKQLDKIVFNDNRLISEKGHLFKLKVYMANMLDIFIHYPSIKWLGKTKKALKTEKGYDLMITVAVPHPIHWAASFIHSRRNIIAKTWVSDCGDPFMGLENGTHKRLFYFKYLEKKWCRSTDYITVPFNGAIKAYYTEFHDKMRVIPQGLTFPEIYNTKKKNVVPTFIYSGNIGHYKHYYIPFFKFLSKISINFKFIIFTKEKELFKKYLNEINGDVEIKDYIEREALINILAQADFLIHFPYKNTNQKSLKLVDYHYSKTPIISYKGADDNIVLKEFLAGNYSNKIPTESIEQYKIKNVCIEFLKLVDN